MKVPRWMAAQTHGLLANGGELAALYCFVFLFIAASGPGCWSLDGLLRRAA